MDKILGLSERQKACLRLVHQGLRTKEIAPIVHLAPASIDTYIRLAMVQLGTSDRREAARILVQFESVDRPTPQVRVDADMAPKDPGAGSISDPSALSEQFVSGSEHLPKSDPDRKNGPRRFGLTTAGLLRPPPVGGVLNDLTYADRIREMLRAACLMVVVVASLTLIFIGALRVLR